MSALEPFAFQVRWGDLDANGHLANVVYLDVAVDARMSAFAQLGFPFAEFGRHGVGPVVKRDTVDYHRELRLHDRASVFMELAGLAPDGSRFLYRNRFERPDGIACAVVETLGGFLDLAARRLVPPPPALLDVLQRLPRTADFQALPSSIKGK